MDSKTKEFMQELKLLLKKYDAVISFEVSDCSDTHGLHGEKLVVGLRELKDGARYRTIVDTQVLTTGWSLSESDI